MNTYFENNSSNSTTLFNQFSSNKYVNASKDFLESNSLIAKISFLLLVILLFVILLKIGINLLEWFLSPVKSPLLINGMIDASQMLTFTQDPSQNNSVTIFRSDNARDGIEFTWSVWLYIKDTVPINNYQHIFHKGNYSFKRNGLNQPNNAPGLYISPDMNNTKSLTLIMNTFQSINEQIIIDNIPLNKWVNVIIRCENNVVDVYINGMIASSHKLHGIPKQNFGDVFVAANGGFNGFISNLSYYNYGLGIKSIENISSDGPNTYMSSGSLSSNIFSDYLSLRWFFYTPVFKDQYNP